jgi:hypothetical protein
MKNWKSLLVPMLFALTGVGFLVGQKNAIAIMFFILAVVISAVSRKSTGGSGPPSA